MLHVQNKRKGTKIPSSGRQQRFSYASDENLLPGVYVCGNGEENKPKAPKLSDVYCYCSNVECGHTFVMNVSFSHTISPSALSGQGRIKELMDALPPEERQNALELLLAAKENQ